MKTREYCDGNAGDGVQVVVTSVVVVPSVVVVVVPPSVPPVVESDGAVVLPPPPLQAVRSAANVIAIRASFGDFIIALQVND